MSRDKVVMIIASTQRECDKIYHKYHEEIKSRFEVDKGIVILFRFITRIDGIRGLKPDLTIISKSANKELITYSELLAIQTTSIGDVIYVE